MRNNTSILSRLTATLAAVVLIFMLSPAAWSKTTHTPVKHRPAHIDSVQTASFALTDSVSRTYQFIDNDSVANEYFEAESKVLVATNRFDQWEERETVFNPDPTRAVWMSALFPGLGQLYNRRYWKLPIVIGAYMGLGYATSWNNSMLNDYTKAYRDIMDNDPGTNSYMDFFPPTTNEADLDRKWLTNILQSRKNFYRRNRDLCIIAMVGVYLIAMVDAYVDASLSHFDITPELSIDVSPALMRDQNSLKPSVGLVWALNF